MAKKEAALKPKQRGRFAAAFFQTLKCWQLIVMVLPAVIIIILFNYVPMYGVTMAFQNYSPSLGFSGSPWVGFSPPTTSAMIMSRPAADGAPSPARWSASARRIWTPTTATRILPFLTMRNSDEKRNTLA